MNSFLLSPSLCLVSALVLALAPVGEAALQTADASEAPTSSSQDCLVEYVVDGQSGARSSLPKGNYIVQAWGSWTYGSNRWYGPRGDPNKNDRQTLMFPPGNYGQLILEVGGDYMGYFDGMQIYHDGGVLRMLMNDRPGTYGDNDGTVTVRFIRVQ